MTEGTAREQFETQKLERFLEDHDLHLLADATEAVSVGSVYKKGHSESKARRIGNIANFITPAITLPEPAKGSQNVIMENFRDKKSLSIVANFVAKFVSSVGLSLNSDKDQILEVVYDKVTYEETDPATFADLLSGHQPKKSMIYDRESDYYVVTKIVRSPNFKVTMKLTRDLKTKIEAQGQQGVVEGSFKMEYAGGKLDEVIATYQGDKSLVFAAHLEKLGISENDEINSMTPLSEAVKLLDIQDRILAL
jgi:hypothetical protein